MSRTVALLDVDETLYFSYQPPPLDVNQINLELIRALKAQKINDIYLFTDMMMEEDIIAHRKALIKFLKSQGFSVHGVITPNDLLWKSPLIYEKKIIRETDPVGYVRHSFKDNQPGIAFNEALHEIERKESLSIDTKNKSRWIARSLVPYFSYKMNCMHPKGLMLEFFLYHLPKWVGKIVVLDDRKAVLESTRQVVALADSLGFSLPQIDTVHVSKKSRGCYYNSKSALQARGLKKMHFFAYLMILSIEREIQRLNVKVLCFNVSPQKTIEALANLKIQIQRELSASKEIRIHIRQDAQTLLDSIKESAMLNKNLLSSVQNYYSEIGISESSNNFACLQRDDVQIVLKEISRLRHDPGSYFFASRQLKADLIEAALLAALTHGCDDVTHDYEVRSALQQHRIFSFFGTKTATALRNVDQAHASTLRN